VEEPVVAAQGVKPQRDPRRRRLGTATLLALLIHAQLVVMVGVLAYWKAPRKADLSSDEMIDITALGEEASREIVADLDRQRAEEEKKQEEEKKKDEEKPNPDRQVVELPPPRHEAPPKEARYAAEHDSTVEKETHHRGAPAEPRPTPPQPDLLAMRAPSPPSRAPGQMGIPGSSEPQISGQDPETESLPRPGRSGAPGAQPTPPSQPQQQQLALMPSQQTLSRALGAGTSDYLPDIDEGEDTALNAKKWKFASFFNRVKEQIRQHWHAAQEYQKRDPTGSLYGGKVRFTVLIVQLNANGSLAGVQLEKPSGVDFLDDVAVEAVKEAQPFPNPPQQLIDRALNKISFRFGFVVDVEGETRLKVFRYSSM
jgi:TonB family protein